MEACPVCCGGFFRRAPGAVWRVFQGLELQRSRAPLPRYLGTNAARAVEAARALHDTSVTGHIQAVQPGICASSPCPPHNGPA